MKNPPTEAAIWDVQKQLPHMSDDAIKQVKDDIEADVERFYEHVGQVPGETFITVLNAEFERRRRQDAEPNVERMNRKQRRVRASKERRK